MAVRASIVCSAVLCGLAAGPAATEELFGSISQGTNMALTLAPDHSTLIVDLMGQLWAVPAAGGGAEPLLPPDEPARNPRFSPDGRSVVYQQFSRGQWDIWLLDLATATRRRLTDSTANDHEPDFAADGRSIVFVSDRGGSDALYRYVLGSGNEIRLYGNGPASWPAVSERGELAFVEQRGGRWFLGLLRDGEPMLAVYSSPNELLAPSWRPGGGVLAFTERRGTDSSDLRMIVLSDEPVVKSLTGGEDVFGFRAAWESPGELIYVADGGIWRRTLGDVVRRPVPLFAGVAVNRPTLGASASIEPGPGPHVAAGLRAASESPTGKLTAFSALGDLWLHDARGRLRQLTDDPFVEIDPAFSPDERRLIFASDRAGSMDIWGLDLDSGDAERLISGPGKRYDPAVAPDGTRIAYLETTGFGPWAPAALKLGGGTEPPQTLARDLLDAAGLAWAADGRSITLWARDPAAPAADRRVQYAYDVEHGDGVWRPIAEPAQPPPAPDNVPVAPAWTPAAPGPSYAIQVDRLFDGTGTQYRRHVDIHIAGRRIAAVSARGLRPLPETVIDHRGYTAIPGLIELHAHESALAGERLGRAWLAFGVTTVREVASHRDDGLERKEAWASGRRLGPRLLLTARHDELSGWPMPSAAARPGYDVAELYPGQPPQLARNVLESAERFGVPVFSEALFPAVRLGINGLEHIGGRELGRYDLERSALSRSYADVIDTLVLSGATVTPTLAAFGGYAALAARSSRWTQDPGYRRLFTAAERAAWDAGVAGRSLASLERTVTRLLRSGARISVGSDAPTVPYGLGLHAELALLAAAGIPPDQVLRLATAGAALALGLERDLGTVEAGKLADLVIVDGNPLGEISDTLRIVAVVQNGVWYDRESLLAPELPASPEAVE